MAHDPSTSLQSNVVEKDDRDRGTVWKRPVRPQLWAGLLHMIGRL
jgi:hypothetical protein